MTDRREVLVDGLRTTYLEAGQGDPIVLLHGGEFGADAALGWETTIDALASTEPTPQDEAAGVTLAPKLTVAEARLDWGRPAEELDRLFAGLSEGGGVLMPVGEYGFSRRFAWVNDRFGVSWQLNLP